VNGAIRRFADPEFHVEVFRVTRPITGVEHVIVLVPGGQTVPVMSKRDCDGVIAQNRCYIRKPGPRSEEPQTREEWRALLNRCVLAQREDMLDAIRAIVTGRVEVAPGLPTAEKAFAEFVDAARRRWAELVAELPADAPATFPHGSYEMAFSLAGAEPAPTLVELRDRLAAARSIRLTGWSVFLDFSAPGLAPYALDNFVEAWVGRPAGARGEWRMPSHSDFWRASRQGDLYTIRGYLEDGVQNVAPGTALDVTMPVWRVGEGLLFAARLAETFEGVEQILIHVRYTGLRGRALVSIDGRRMMFGDSVSQSDEITLNARATLAQVRDNLAEVLLTLLRRLYEKFAFFDLPRQLVGEEIQHLQRGRF
jgi:hypothetical protein